MNDTLQRYAADYGVAYVGTESVKTGETLVDLLIPILAIVAKDLVVKGVSALATLLKGLLNKKRG